MTLCLYAATGCGAQSASAQDPPTADARSTLAADLPSTAPLADVGPPDALHADSAALGPCLDGDQMMLIPKGPFLFGQAKLSVDIPHDYCLDRTEVTAAAYLDCVADGGCDGYEMWAICSEGDPLIAPNQCLAGRGDHPANYVDWYRAEQYCTWIGKRLPRGAEWEKGARGTIGWQYPWGDALSCSYAHQGRGSVFDDCVDFAGLPNHTVPVGSYPVGASPYGLLDVSGNVKEWIDHRTDTSQPPDPSKPGISRGGSFFEGEWMVTAYAGDGTLGPHITSKEHGFRCAADALTSAR